MIKLLFLFFLINFKVRCCFLYNHTLIVLAYSYSCIQILYFYILIVFSLQWQLPSICTVWNTGSNMEILKQEIRHNNFCQQNDRAAVLCFLNHFYFESFSSHIISVHIFVYLFIKLAIFIVFLLSSTVLFFLHCMLSILIYEKIFYKIDESIALQHNPSSDSIFLGVHSESIFPFTQYFFFKKTVFHLLSLALAYR